MDLQVKMPLSKPTTEKSTEVNSLLTKLDGTVKGGVVIGITDQFKIPVKYIGVGEGVDQLQVFNRFEFIDSLFKDSVFKINLTLCYFENQDIKKNKVNVITLGCSKNTDSEVMMAQLSKSILVTYDSEKMILKWLL